MDSGWLLFANIAVPIAAALIIMAIPSTYKQQVRWVATAAAFTMFVLSVSSSPSTTTRRAASSSTCALALAGERGLPGEGRHQPAPGGGRHLGADGAADGHRRSSPAASSPGRSSTGTRTSSSSSCSWCAASSASFQSLDLFFFFFFYELAVLPMYLLIGVWGASSNFGTYVRTKEYGAMKLTMYLVGGSVLVFIGIFATFVEAGQGTFDLPVLGQVASTRRSRRRSTPSSCWASACWPASGPSTPGRPTAMWRRPRR